MTKRSGPRGISLQGAVLAGWFVLAGLLEFTFRLRSVSGEGQPVSRNAALLMALLAAFLWTLAGWLD